MHFDKSPTDWTEAREAFWTLIDTWLSDCSMPEIGHGAFLIMLDKKVRHSSDAHVVI